MSKELNLFYESTVFTSRTRYQLKHFVIGQHDTLPMQWKQIVIEAQDLSYRIRSAEIQLEKTKIEYERLLETGDPIDALDAEQKKIDMVLTNRVLEGARIELKWLEEFAEETGFHTFEEIEEDQPEYWARRLHRQADTDILSREQGISTGNIQSLINAGFMKYNDNQKSVESGD